MSGEQVTLTIDGQEITVPIGTLVIRAAEQLGIYVPRFCDHPLLDPLGACRQCLVEVEGQRKPLTACTTACMDGMVVKTQATSEVAAQGQEGVLELLLINHPLDCPMCDKGGECPLQDQALAYGPADSRYVDEKRRFVKPIPISPAIKLDRERCVLCARCTRFADQISGDPFIELFERGALEQVSISPDEPYESIFSGNVVQICPVGALTASDYRFQARPFDVVTTSSTCNRCASGCAIDVQTRRGRLVRVLAERDDEVNDEWLCDKGRWGTGYLAAPERITEPMMRKDDGFVAVSWAEALRVVAERFTEARDEGAPIGVIGGAQLADEDSYALSRFARTVLKTNDVDARPRARNHDAEFLAALPGSSTATNADIDAASVIIVAGIDIQQESPIVFLRLRKAARRGATIIEVGPRATALTGTGATHVSCVPGGEAGAILGIAARLIELDPESGFDPWTRAAAETGGSLIAAAGLDDGAADEVATAVKGARGRVVVLGGDALLDVPSAAPLAWNLAVAFEGTFGWVPRKAGARGAAWAGLHPSLLPGGRVLTNAEDRGPVEDVWGASVPDAPGRDVAAMLSSTDKPGVLLLAGADPVSDGDDPAAATRALGGARFVVALDMFMTPSAQKADVILPVAAGLERAGTITNWEGRRRSLNAIVPPPGLAQSDHEVLAALAADMGDDNFPRTTEALRKEIERLAVAPSPARALPVSAPDAASPRAGMVAVVVPMLLDEGSMMVGAESLRATGGGTVVGLSAADAERIGVAAGDQVRVKSARGEICGPVRIDAGLRAGTVVLPRNNGAPASNTVVGGAGGSVEVEAVR